MPPPSPEWSPEKNGRKIRSRSSGRIPGPVSPTTTYTNPLSDDSPRSTRPPSGVQRNAFESRLEMI